MPQFRMDRFLTVNFFNQLRFANSRSGRAAILMYHSISDGAETGIAPYYRVATHPKIFAEHMALLRAEGCHVTGLKSGLELLRRGCDFTRKLVMITFDDGFRDFLTEAFPVLQQNGFGATMFLPTAFINPKRRKFKDRDCMTWDEVRECRAGGIEFGSHTVNHPRLYEMDFPQIKTELKDSRAMMEQELNESITTFAYPYAFPSGDRPFVKIFTDLLKETGYECNVTTRIGCVGQDDDAFTLKRLPANSADDAEFFLAKLHGAYDWLNRPQETFKKLKSLITSPRSIVQPHPSLAR